MTSSFHTMIRKAKHSLEQRTGIRVVRACSFAADACAQRSQRTTFLPPGDHVRGGWSVPDDLLVPRNSAWWPVLEALYSRPHAWPGSVAPETGLLLYSLIRNIRPTTIVETGTCHGASTIWMAAALESAHADNPGAHVHTFDLFELDPDSRLREMPLYKDQVGQVRKRFKDSGLDHRITLHVGDSSANIRHLAQQHPNLPIEFAYIDADHSYAGVTADFQAVDPLIPVGGYVMLHDIFPSFCGWDGPRTLLDSIRTLTDSRYQHCDVYTSPNNYGLAILRKVS